MSSHYAKPENALRKAKDLKNLNKPKTALKTLSQILTNKRYKVWQQTHEKIMLLYAELAVSLRESVKDAFVQYRMICQSAQSSSLDRVLREYQRLAELTASEKLSATGLAEADVVSGMEDLEEETPNDLLIQAAASAPSDEHRERDKTRRDRQAIIPWIKYLWDAYRTILEVARNNSKLELLYHDVARAAFQFCLRFKRSMEFRRMCDIFRVHLMQIARYQNQQNAVDLSSPDTQKLYLETRFDQLRAAAKLELWQEAYRTIADIHESTKQMGKEPKTKLLKEYYENLAQIFWASENHLFHAYSLNKFLSLCSVSSSASSDDDKSFSIEDKQRLSCAVLLASLIIPQTEHDAAEDAFAGEHEANTKLAELLGFKRETPTRTKLLQSLLHPANSSVLNATPGAGTAATAQSGSILNDVTPAVKTVYTLLEDSVTPLTLYAQIKGPMAEIESDSLLKKYVPTLQQLIVLRVLQQLSSVYRTVKFSKLKRLLPESLSSHTIERWMMHYISTNQLSLRIDHMKELIIFAEESLESQRMREQLVLLSRSLAVISKSISSPNPNEKLAERSMVFTRIQENLQADHEAVFARLEEIEKRKLAWEQYLSDKERKEYEQKERIEQEKKEAIQKRQAEEAAKREAERQRLEEEQKQEEKRKQLEALRKLQEETDAKKREDDRRRKETWKRIDYFLRALRLEERDELRQQQEKQRADESDSFNEEFQKFVNEEKAKHDKLIAEKIRILRTVEQKEHFLSHIMARRHQEFEEKKKQQDERALENARRRIGIERRKRAEEEAKRKEQERLAEIERQRKAEEEKKQLEAEERRAKEREEAKKYREEQDRRAELQRKREQEIEDREKEKEKLKKDQEKDKRRELEKSRDQDPWRNRESQRQPERRDDRRDERRDERAFERRDERRDDRDRERERERDRDSRGPIRREERDRPPRDRGDRDERVPKDEPPHWRREERGPPRDRERERDRDEKQREDKEWRRDAPQPAESKADTPANSEADTAAPAAAAAVDSADAVQPGDDSHGAGKSEERGGWGRGGAARKWDAAKSDSRGPPRDRGYDRERERRDDPRGPPRDRERERDRDHRPRDFDRDRERPPRRDFDRERERDSRGPPRRVDERDNAADKNDERGVWRRDGDRDRERERDAPRRGGFDRTPRDRDNDRPRERERDRDRGDNRGPRRDFERRPVDRDAGNAGKSDEAEKENRSDAQVDDDGFTVVNRRK